MRIVKIVILLGVLGGAALGARAYLRRDEAPKRAAFRTAEVHRGDLVQTIAATGTVEPEEVVDIGAQVAGTIVSFGEDVDGKPVDYGSHVKEGAVLVRIDDSIYAADLRVAKAQLEAATAGVTLANANVQQVKAKLTQAKGDWERAQKLGPSDALSRSAYDGYRAAFDIATADVGVQEAAVLQAKASVTQAAAAVDRAQRNLGYCTILSPVDGVVIDRRVNIGQTVVSSLNAPSLFLLAKDLRRMEVWVAVNEADIGRIRAGQTVHFTVDAFPGESFDGEVEKVRLNAQMTQNVVTYTVVIRAGNEKGRLLPYLTANVKFVTAEEHDVLVVPNAALRYRPAADRIAAGATEPAPGQAVVWVPDGASVRPVPIVRGASDDTTTEISGEGVSPAMRVVVGEDGGGATGGSSEVNPFAPQFRRPSGGGRQ